MGMNHVVVVGASLAGATAADALRGYGYEGQITVVGAEDHPPYTRPPLSKAVLLGDQPPESVFLQPLGDDIELRLGQPARQLDLNESAVVLADEERIPFDGLIIATGARARTLAKPEQQGEHTLRGLNDAVNLRGRIAEGPEALILGGGLLGMEIASSCRKHGLAVTVVDREPLLRRVLGEALSSVLVSAAVADGVKVEISEEDVELVGSPQIEGVRLADGRVLRADLIITAAGDLPNVEWLAGSGLFVDRALVVDSRGRALSHVVGAGDAVVVRENDTLIRRPHWASAVDQARLAAATLLDGDAAPIPGTTPYFWTDQFGYEIRITGERPTTDRISVIEGALDEGSAVLQWLDDDDSIVAAATVNHRMALPKLKRLAYQSPAPAA